MKRSALLIGWLASGEFMHSTFAQAELDARLGLKLLRLVYWAH